MLTLTAAISMVEEAGIPGGGLYEYSI